MLLIFTPPHYNNELEDFAKKTYEECYSWLCVVAEKELAKRDIAEVDPRDIVQNTFYRMLTRLDMLSTLDELRLLVYMKIMLFEEIDKIKKDKLERIPSGPNLQDDLDDKVYVWQMLQNISP